MPIVDGLTSTKMIRKLEKSKTVKCLSTLAALNGRVPVIAVSASLVEKERQTYIDAGFDAWILKPISFSRLNELMNGIVNREIREAALYKPGEWEKGGWFSLPDPETLPQRGKGVETKDQLLAKDDPKSTGKSTAKSHSAPQFTLSEAGPSSSKSITGGEQVRSPDPME
jgi:CheY-like chemotaxis protein